VQLCNFISIVTTGGMNVGYFKTRPFNSEQWVSNIYKKENDTWICIMTQEAAVVCASSLTKIGSGENIA
jgi:hypothetical protein